MRPINSLLRDDARRIARHFGMTDFELVCSPVAATAATRHYSKNRASIVVEDDQSRTVTTELVHLRWNQLETMPEDLRRKLLSCGHVYINLGDARMISGFSLGEANARHSVIHPESEIFGSAVGAGRYTEPLSGVDDMGCRMSFYRMMPEAWGTRDGQEAAQLADSDLRLFLDLGAIEAVALAPASRGLPAR